MTICSCATTNNHLKTWIDSNGEPRRCELCGRPTVDGTRFAEHIDRIVRRHYTPNLDNPEYGEDPTPLIRRLAGVDDTMAARVQGIVHDDEPPGGPTFYDYGRLQFRERVFGEYARKWSSLKKITMSEARFLSAETRSILNMVLGDMATFRGGAAIRHLVLGERIVRARKTHSIKEAFEWCRAADESALRAPKEPRANRMNAAGIRVFYGALQERIAIAEVQPPIGSYVVLSAFTPTRPLTVLDLGALGNINRCVDLFDPEFDVVSERLTFLRMLEQEISRPIQAAEDPLGYLPTQIMAEYVHTELRLDGLAYRSTQTGRVPSGGQVYGARLEPMERNVVLFGAAALTTSEKPGEGREPGLQFLPEARQVVDVTQIEIHYNQHPGVGNTVDPRRPRASRPRPDPDRPTSPPSFRPPTRPSSVSAAGPADD